MHDRVLETCGDQRAVRMLQALRNDYSEVLLVQMLLPVGKLQNLKTSNHRRRERPFELKFSEYFEKFFM